MSFLNVDGIDIYQVAKELHVSSVSSVACRAAIELDNARIGGDTSGFRMCRLMVTWLRGVNTDQRWCWTEAFMSILWPLFKPDREGETTIPTPFPLTHVDHLILMIDHMAGELERIIAHPEHHRANDCAKINAMRDFCLAVSEQASLAEHDSSGFRRALAA